MSDKVNTCIYSKEACELMAKQLMAEQAEVIKREATVEGLKKVIMEKKKEIIRDCFNKFYFDFNREMLALELDFCDFENDFMTVHMFFGANPYKELKGVKLTKREKELLEKYRMATCYLPSPYDQGKGKEARLALEELMHLKNRICMLMHLSWEVFISESSQPGFFDNSGLEIKGIKGMRNSKQILEDFIVK